MVLHVSGEVIRSVAEQRIHNQAWFDSPHTPYGAEPDASSGEWAGVPTARDNHVTEPTPPDDANIDPNTHDVTGNVSCSTGTDTADAPEREHSFLTGGEDSCDQVGLIIPPHPPNRRSVRSAARSGVTPTTTVCGRTGSRRWRASTYTCWTPRASACPATRP